MSVFEARGAGLSVDAETGRQTSANAATPTWVETETSEKPDTRTAPPSQTPASPIESLTQTDSLSLIETPDPTPNPFPVQQIRPRVEVADGPHRILTRYSRWAKPQT